VNVSRRELLHIIGVVFVVWLVLVAGLAKWQRWQAARDTEAAVVEVDLPHYPGTEDIQEQTSPTLGWRKYWFELDEGYPSKSVVYFYRNQLEQAGWRLLGPGEPEWYRRESPDEVRDLLQAVWLSPDALFQIQVDLVSVVDQVMHEGEPVGEQRQPGMYVYVTLSRAMMPMLIRPGPERPRPRSEIEVP